MSSLASLSQMTDLSTIVTRFRAISRVMMCLALVTFRQKTIVSFLLSWTRSIGPCSLLSFGWWRVSITSLIVIQPSLVVVVVTVQVVVSVIGVVVGVPVVGVVSVAIVVGVGRTVVGVVGRLTF